MPPSLLGPMYVRYFSPLMYAKLRWDGENNPNRHMQDICKKLSSLKQEWVLGDGKPSVDTPDELFNRTLQLATWLPDDATTWPLQLCSTYFSVLTSNLSHQMTEEDKFVMPVLHLLTTKASQLNALRSVRTSAATSF